jgi:hypothetical protein
MEKGRWRVGGGFSKRIYVRIDSRKEIHRLSIAGYHAGHSFVQGPS